MGTHRYTLHPAVGAMQLHHEVEPTQDVRACVLPLARLQSALPLA